MGAFHAYDIRGVYNRDFDKNTVYKIGNFLPGLMNCKRILVGRDARTSSPEIWEYLTKGITDAGADVYDLGLATTPMVYFGTANYGFDCSVQITASHNPKEYNGLKVSGKYSLPVGYDNGLAELERMVNDDRPCVRSSEKGKIIEFDVKKDYLLFLSRYKGDYSGLKIAMDLSNGMASLLAKDIFGTSVLYLFDEIDGTFPNHEANPLVAENRAALEKAVAEHKCDVGVIYDGDADRVMFVDEKSQFISPDLMIAVLGHYFLDNGDNESNYDGSGNYRSGGNGSCDDGNGNDRNGRNGNSEDGSRDDGNGHVECRNNGKWDVGKGHIGDRHGNSDVGEENGGNGNSESGNSGKGIVLQDIRSSKSVAEYLVPMGADVRTWKVGRAYAARKLREIDGLFGGELAGHYYFKDFFYSDSGIMASLIMLDVIAKFKKEGVALSELVSRISKYKNSGEMNFRIVNKKEAMDKVKDYFVSEESPEAFYDFDGYRIEFKDWWFNIRPSNTEPYLRFIAEARTEDILLEKVSKAVEIIRMCK